MPFPGCARRRTIASPCPAASSGSYPNGSRNCSGTTSTRRSWATSTAHTPARSCAPPSRGRSRLPGPYQEEVRGDPGVGDLRVRGSGPLIGAGLGDRLDDQAAGEDGGQPPGEGPPRVRDRERPVPVPQFGRPVAEAPRLGERALVEVVANGPRLPYA